MEWINVKDKLPDIPEGKHSVRVIIAVYDGCYAECCNDVQKGYSVTDSNYGPPDPKTGYTEPWFCNLVFGQTGWPHFAYVDDQVTHWMYMPEAPIYESR